MKMTFFILIVLMSIRVAIAQSITIDPSSLQLPQFATNPACTVADRGKLIFNTSQKKVLFCNGSAWKETGNGTLTLPFAGTAEGNANSFEITNTGTGIAIKGVSSANHGIEAISQAPSGDYYGVRGVSTGSGSAGVLGTSTKMDGIGVQANNTYGGNALVINGAIRISGGDTAPAAGKVLTSDANGNATWQNPPTLNPTKIGFSVGNIMGGGLNVLANGTWSKVHFSTEEYDPGNDYNATTTAPSSTFTAPQSGRYHFNAQVTWYGSSGSPTMDRSSIRLMRKRGSTVEEIAGNGFYVQEQESLTNRISKLCNLETGDQVWVEAAASPEDGSNPIIRTASSNLYNQFSGYLVY